MLSEAPPTAEPVQLGDLLEEATTRSPSLRQQEDTVPIPTLASLLLSTAASLSSPPADSAVLANPTSTEYLASLLALPLPSLLALPTTLSALSTSLNTDLSLLAFTRYSSFLLAHSSTLAISTSFTSLSTELSSLLGSTEALEESAKQFEARVGTVKSKRERMGRVRERMEEVEELLEAPTVVDACVRAGLWSEAIDVAARLAELHMRMSAGGGDGAGGAVFLLERVRSEVSLALLSLRARVLESLVSRSLKLPGAVRGVGILRRISAGGLGLGGEQDDRMEMEEDALRIVFLAARWRCLRAELESVEGYLAASGVKLSVQSTTEQAEAGDVAEVVGPEENEERTRWTKRWIEVWREVVGETIGMYTEVFLTPSSSSAFPSSAALPPSTLSPTAPLTLFLSTSLTSLTTTLSCTLPALSSPASLSSLQTQLAYCSHSFARHGLEFREFALLRERIEARVGAIVRAQWDLAGREWEREWRDGGIRTGEGGESRKRPGQGIMGRERDRVSDWLVVAEGMAIVLATPLPSASTAAWHHQPAPALALLPPLARFLNAHATALNSLRLLPALSLRSSLRTAQTAHLARAAKALVAFVVAWLGARGEPMTTTTTARGRRSSDPSEEERRQEREEKEERTVVWFAVAAFGRWVVPWCESGLNVGVYGEVGLEVDEEDEEGRGEVKVEGGVQEVVRSLEALVARLERKVVEQELAQESEPTVAETTNGAADDVAIAAPPPASPPGTVVTLPSVSPSSLPDTSVDIVPLAANTSAAEAVVAGKRELEEEVTLEKTLEKEVESESRVLV